MNIHPERGTLSLAAHDWQLRHHTIHITRFLEGWDGDNHFLKRRRWLGEVIRMQFLLGVLLFVIVIGSLDSRLPWPVVRRDMPILPGNMAHLPRLGFGLWRFPWVSAAIEAVLVLLGARVYWIAARSVSTQAKPKPRLAAAIAVLIAICGIFILYLDVST